MTVNHDATDVAAPSTLAEQAKVSPTDVFANPKDVVASPELTADENAEVLEQWESDAIALQTATDEGMSGGKRPGLEEVKKAQSVLEKDALESHSLSLSVSPQS